MSAFFPGRSEASSDGRPVHTLVDLRESRESRARRWAGEAARWRAHEVAGMVFGEPVHSRLQRAPGGGGLHGLLHLDVPFHSLESHRESEQDFLAAAAADPVLAQVPVVYIFGCLREAVR